MKYLSEWIKQTNEEAATGSVGTSSVAAVPTRVGEKKKREKKRVEKAAEQVLLKRNLKEQDEEFDQNALLSKLKTAELDSTVEQTVTFGLEDENGNVVKVKVAADQAEEFQSALDDLLSDDSENNDNVEQIAAPEIAEVLFSLKDRFDIVDVDWHDIEGDEDEESLEDVGNEDNTTGEEPSEDNAGEEMTMDEPTEPDTSTQTALQQVIAMMQADAEAKKAEAEAKKAEAAAREAEINRQSAEQKIKQEEMYLDMEEYGKAKKEEEKETKRLAQLAKYRHDLKKDSTQTEPQPDNSEELDFEDEEAISPSTLVKALRFLNQKQN